MLLRGRNKSLDEENYVILKLYWHMGYQDISLCKIAWSDDTSQYRFQFSFMIPTHIFLYLFLWYSVHLSTIERVLNQIIKWRMFIWIYAIVVFLWIWFSVDPSLGLVEVLLIISALLGTGLIARSSDGLEVSRARGQIPAYTPQSSRWVLIIFFHVFLELDFLFRVYDVVLVFVVFCVYDRETGASKGCVTHYTFLPVCEFADVN